LDGASNHIPDADLADGFKFDIERRLRLGLGRFGRRLGQITVRIGADGKTDTRCWINVDILPVGQVAVEERDVDLFVPSTVRRKDRPAVRP